MNAPQPHLTPEQIEDTLLGDLPAGAAAHLASCTLCREHVDEARDSIAAFNTVSLAWSERRSATLPAVDVSASDRTTQPRTRWALAAATAVLAVAVGLSAPWTHRAVPAPAAATADQIAADNRMLTAIDTELQSSSVSSVEAYELRPASSAALPHAVTVRNE